MPLRLQIFDDFLTSFWYPISSDFGANLAPTRPPTWAQNRSKIDPSAIQNPSQLACCFRLVFGSIFDRLLIDFRSKNRPKINQKSSKTSSQQRNKQKINMLNLHLFLQYNRALSYVVLSTKIHKNQHNIHQKTALKFMLQFSSILEPTWLCYGKVWGDKMGPRWHQIDPKIDPKIMKNRSKNHI